MDFISHFLIGILIAKIFSLTGISLYLFLIGTIFPDISVIPLSLYYKSYDNIRKNEKKEPKTLFKIYDFFHSIILLVIIFILGIYFPYLNFLGVGIIMHILIDIPLHKRHPPGIFFPFNFRIKGIVDWYDLYEAIKSRIIIWFAIILLIILFYILK